MVSGRDDLDRKEILVKTDSITHRLYNLHRNHERLWWVALFVLGALATCVLAYSLAAW